MQFQFLPFLLLTACTPELVTWSDAQPVREEVPVGAELLLSDEGKPLFAAAVVMEYVPEGACEGSVVFAHGGGGEWHAAWWAPRGDGSVELLTARSDDSGESWTPPELAEGRDRGARGCARPAPGIAADSVGGYVHLAYWLEPPREQGVWYSHSMERGALWHAPVAIIFGTDPARASVAAHGDTVVVAYEHPNAAEGRVGIAVSRSAGHMIDGRATASVGGAVATNPHVAVRGRAVAVSWTSRQGRAQGAPEHLMVRRGEVRF